MNDLKLEFDLFYDIFLFDFMVFIEILFFDLRELLFFIVCYIVFYVLLF